MSDDGDDSFVESSSNEGEDDIPSSKSKPKKIEVKKKAAPPPSSASEDDMDVDEDLQSSAKKGKRRAKGDGNMHTPPLEMFHFARVVVDEYTYLDEKVHAVVNNLTAPLHWVLSRTPPVHDFGALKTIFAFLDVHLHIDNDGEGQSAEIKKCKKEHTDIENFHSFREVGRFLDRFVRQNIAEIDEIPWREKTVDVILPTAERVIYLELEHYLRALEMTIKRGRKTESNTKKRVAQSLGESKRNSPQVMLTFRSQKQLNDCKENLLSAIKDGVKREKDLNNKLNNAGGESMFLEWLRIYPTDGVEDLEAMNIIRSLIEKADAPTMKAKSRKDDITLSESVKAQVWDHHEKTHEIRWLTKSSLVAFVLCDILRLSETCKNKGNNLQYYPVLFAVARHSKSRMPLSCHLEVTSVVMTVSGSVPKRTNAFILPQTVVNLELE
ncbi:hypothetical protein F5879DRAFT_990500 [Lentinula edodes]|nr:hypothetical protein F5879DRAFT_990500 [Lentinula edodes]